MKQNIWKRLKNNSFLVLIFSLLIFLFLSTYNINRYFNGFHDFNTALFAVSARNSARVGLLNTKLGFTRNILTTKDTQPSYYLTHPQLSPLLAYPLYKLNNISEYLLRILPIFASTISLIFIWLISKHLLGSFYSLICVLIASYLPVLVYFSRIYVQDIFVLMFGLISAYLALKIKLLKLNKISFALFGINTVMLLFDWSGLFWMFWTFLILFLKKGIKLGNKIDFKKFIWILSFYIICGLSTLIVILLHIYILGNRSFSVLYNQFLIRVGSVDFSNSQWLDRQILWLGENYNTVVWVTAIIGLVLLITKIIINKTKNYANIVILSSIIPGLLNVVLFKNAAWNHQYWQLYLLPFIVFCASYVVYHFRVNMIFRILMVFVCMFLIKQSYSYTRGLLEYREFPDANIVFLKNLSKELSLYTGEICVNGYFGPQYIYYLDHEFVQSDCNSDSRFINSPKIFINPKNYLKNSLKCNDDGSICYDTGQIQ